MSARRIFEQLEAELNNPPPSVRTIQRIVKARAADVIAGGPVAAPAPVPKQSVRQQAQSKRQKTTQIEREAWRAAGVKAMAEAGNIPTTPRDPDTMTVREKLTGKTWEQEDAEARANFAKIDRERAGYKRSEVILDEHGFSGGATGEGHLSTMHVMTTLWRMRGGMLSADDCMDILFRAK